MSFRVEQKYLTSSSSAPQLYSWLEQNNSKTLYQDRNINSIYFDSLNFSTYWDSNEGLVPRKKVRVRCYGKCIPNISKYNFEIKISSIEGRFKTSSRIDNVENLIKHGYFDNQYGLLMPVVKISYIREYYFVNEFRLTIDKNIQYSSFNLNNEICLNRSEENFALEIKSSNSDSTELLDLNFPFQKTRFSKYCRAVESLNLINS